jgi:glycosyltransferase involved in cell wall biosynthesis
MRILFFIDSLTSGGKERRLIELMKMLILRQDIQFELIVMSNDIHYKEVFDLDIKIHYLIRKTKKDPYVFYKFYKICKRYNPDIVHCWDSMTAIYSIPACKFLNIKFVNGMVVDAPLKQNIFNNRLFRAKLTFPFSNIIIGNSKAGLEAYGVPKKKSFLIHNGFNFERTNNIIETGIIRKQLEINTQFVIGMVASFSEYKDYKTYFGAAQLLLNQRNDIIFLAIGSNTDSILSKSLILNKHIEHFRLLGKKSDIESFINAMDICVLSTFTEGISNSILEYMALGKPVIASSGGGTNEIVDDTKTGFLISPSDPKELAKKIEILLNDAKLRNNMGLAGKARIKERFSINRMASKYVSFYEMTLSS